jgi:hypothetical protein
MWYLAPHRWSAVWPAGVGMQHFSSRISEERLGMGGRVRELKLAPGP